MFTVIRIVCIVLWHSPVVVRAPDVRLRITCGAKAETIGLRTNWKLYKRGTPSDSPYLLFRSDHDLRLRQRTRLGV